MKSQNVYIFGGTGIVGKSLAIRMKLSNYEVRTFGRDDLDFSSRKILDGVGLTLSGEESQILIFAAGEFPVRDEATLAKNIILADNFCKVFGDLSFAKIVYVSSDAVYSPSEEPIDELGSINHQSLHARCHTRREEIFKSYFPEMRLLILRPVALFGPNDTHHSYGPNAFARSIRDTKKVELWGEGAELRDHLFEVDFAKFVTSLIQKGSYGIFNIASGRLVSFRRMAEMLFDLSGNSKEILFRLRKEDVVIEKSRAISIEKLISEIGDYESTPLQQSLKSLLH